MTLGYWDHGHTKEVWNWLIIRKWRCIIIMVTTTMRYYRGNDVRNSVRLHCIYAKTSHVLLHKLSEKQASSSQDNNATQKYAAGLFSLYISRSRRFSLAEPWRIGNLNKKAEKCPAQFCLFHYKWWQLEFRINEICKLKLLEGLSFHLAFSMATSSDGIFGLSIRPIWW